MRTIAVVDYDPSWPEAFERLRSHVWAVLSDVAMGIDQVGSTAVPGLAAKPVIDIGIVVRDEVGVASAIGRLATLGYVHRGNLGIEGREAFANPPTGLPEHNLYVCPAGSVALGNHLAVRDYLRAHHRHSTAVWRLEKAACDNISTRYRQLYRRKDRVHPRDSSRSRVLGRAVGGY
jgi:GrpB-like predicted nucleotidyltransferase (UPF0157 family)